MANVMKSIKVPFMPIPTPNLMIQNHHGDLDLFLMRHGAKRYLYMSYGRVALLESLKVLNINKYNNILVPAYICGKALALLDTIGVEIKFYSIENNLEPNLESMESQIDSNTRAIMTINYFGFPQRTHNQVRMLCDKYNLYLIEDSAHSPLSRIDSRLLGTFGDIGFTSLYKIFPIRNGAILFINNSQLNDSAIGDLPFISNMDDLKYFAGSMLNYMGINYEALIQILRRRHNISSNVPKNNRCLNQLELPRSMSYLSLKTINRLDLNKLIKARSENYKFWLDKLSGWNGIYPTFDKIPEGVCPGGFPLIAERPSEFIKAMRALGIDAFNWPNLPEQVKGNILYQHENYLSEHLVLLPNQQDLRIHYLDEKLKKIDFSY